MKNEKPRKVTRKGSGRTAGSYSFVSIPLSDLLAKFNDMTTPITVGRKFAEAVGFKVESAPANEISGKIAGKTAATAITIKVHDLDSEAPVAAPVVKVTPAQ